MANKKGRKLYPKENIVKILLLIIVVWFVATILVNQVRSSLIQTERLSVTVLEHIEEGYGLLSGEEVAIAAPADGVVERLVTEGNRVRKGNAVFSANGVIAYTNNAGRVSYQIDGLEGITDLSAICGTNLEERYAAQQSDTGEPQTTDAVSGAVYAKVINTFDEIYLYITVPHNTYTDSLEVDKQIPVRLTDLDYEVTAQVTDIVDAGDSGRYLKLKLSDVKEIVFQQRIYKIELPYNRTSAIAVPKEAVVEKHGKTGVYYLQKGFVLWQEVTLGDEWPDLGLVVVEQTEENSGLEAGDVIVTTPHLVHEGENIKF